MMTFFDFFFVSSKNCCKSNNVLKILQTLLLLSIMLDYENSFTTLTHLKPTEFSTCRTYIQQVYAMRKRFLASFISCPVFLPPFPVSRTDAQFRLPTYDFFPIDMHYIIYVTSMRYISKIIFAVAIFGRWERNEKCWCVWQLVECGLNEAKHESSGWMNSRAQSSWLPIIKETPRVSAFTVSAEKSAT